MTGAANPPAEQPGHRGADRTAADPVLTSVWDLPEHGTRGPKARHDRAAIAAAAVQIADARGIDGLTMRHVASALGMATMSLYNYVPAKGHLAQLVIDQVAGEFTYPAGPPGDKRSAIAGLARQARAIAQRHPWLASLMQRPYPPGPNGLRYLDYFLGLLDDSGLDTGARLEVIALISGFATMYGTMQATLTAQHASVTEQTAMQVQAFARAAASGRYPHLAAALAAAGPARAEDAIFESSIQRLIEVARPGDSRAAGAHSADGSQRWPE
jgi:AcrR family transcriptional regulator